MGTAEYPPTLETMHLYIRWSNIAHLYLIEGMLPSLVRLFVVQNEVGKRCKPPALEHEFGSPAQSNGPEFTIESDSQYYMPVLMSIDLGVEDDRQPLYICATGFRTRQVGHISVGSMQFTAPASVAPVIC